MAIPLPELCNNQTVLGIGVPTIAGIRHNNDEIGSSKQAFYVGSLEPTVMMPDIPCKRYKTGISSQSGSSTRLASG